MMLLLIEEQKKKPVCHKCKVTFIPITARIKNCRYEFIGQKIENDEVQHVDYKNETYGREHIDDLKIENNVLPWLNLKITSKKR